MGKFKASWRYLTLLIFAAESIFFLPYVLCRIFRPTVLEVFELDNIQLGLCFSVYGFVAVLSYLFGGPIADKYPPRKLIAFSLWLTSIGGLVYASYPSYFVLKLLYGYWGFTTVFLFWAPMVKAARLWGASSSQLKAFGLLEGGRGVVGAFIGTIGVLMFSFFINEESTSISLNERRNAFKYVIYFSSFIVAFVGILVWRFMNISEDLNSKIVLEKISVQRITEVLSLPSVLLLMLIVLCAYMGYKTTDVISLYANEVMLYNQVESAQIATFLLYARPAIALLIGLFFIRFNSTFLLVIGFVVSFCASLLFCTGIITNTSTGLFMISILALAIGVYGLRTLYFAVMEKGEIPLKATGTAVGLISIVGYAPDVFSGPVIGYLLEQYKGVEGYTYVFALLLSFSFIGFLASWKYHKLYGN
tara:strand:- start:126 stop:1379 length:1254 start_codon:yes stop_codon:yes gene_type:complete